MRGVIVVPLVNSVTIMPARFAWVLRCSPRSDEGCVISPAG